MIVQESKSNSAKILFVVLLATLGLAQPD